MRKAALAWVLAGALPVLGAYTCAVESSAASPSPSASRPIVASCANPDLPPELLDGTVPPVPQPLAVVTATAPGVTLRLAVAANESTREQGLMCVLKLRPHHGMIFVFDRDSNWEFWMKDTLAPLDMLWIAPDGTVANVAADVPAATLSTPDDAVARRNGHGTFVIELAAGEAAADGLKAGVRIKLPPLHASSN